MRAVCSGTDGIGCCGWSDMAKPPEITAPTPLSTLRLTHSPTVSYAWRDSRLWETINQLLVMSARELEGREASPTAGVIDSQSVKTTESGGPSGYDAGKKINSRKRHIATDTLGLMLFVLVHAADVQDRDGAPALLQAIRHRFPWLRHIFADGGYAGGKLRDALKGQGDWTIEIIKRSDTARGTHTRLARPVPMPRQGLGENNRKLQRLGSRRQHQAPLT